jgi:hypothetical protein
VKLEALGHLLTHHGRLKLFVVTDAFCLCGQAWRHQDAPGGALVDIGASVRVVFETMVLIHEPLRSGTLRFDRDTKCTRRLGTHRRHLAGRDVPDAYFAAAMTL